MEIHALDICVAGLALWLVGRLIRRRKAPLPPGPSGWPLIGNLFEFSPWGSYESLGRLSKKYGPIISLEIGMGLQRFVVLNSIRAANDLLDKKSATTSNRPHFTMSGDLVGWGRGMLLLQYGDMYRRHRKFFHQQIGTKSSLEAFHSAEEAEARQFICNVLERPEDLVSHSRRAGGATILNISHGYTVEKDNDPLVEMAEKALHNFTTVTAPGAFLVDTFPILRHLPEWFPGGGFHRDARRWRKMLDETAAAPHNFVLEHLEKGDAAPSFTSRILQEGVSPEDEEILKWAALSMYLGGSDTTQSTLTAFFLAMAIYPEVLKKAQAEVDAIVGQDRLPTMQDRDALPYVNALCMELLRWHVVAPLVMHVTTQDEIYDGYFIHKGTCLLGNAGFILSDPDNYPNPKVFDPERFIGDNQQMDPRDACFGWGRRSCPGSLLAESFIFICAATALATLNVLRRVENGAEVVPTYDVNEGPLRHVKPFPYRTEVRSKRAEYLLYC